jgi:hypothetical protein
MQLLFRAKWHNNRTVALYEGDSMLFPARSAFGRPWHIRHLAVHGLQRHSKDLYCFPAESRDKICGTVCRPAIRKMQTNRKNAEKRLGKGRGLARTGLLLLFDNAAGLLYYH